MDNTTLSIAEYCRITTAFANQAMSLPLLFHAFGLFIAGPESPDLLMGFLLEELSQCTSETIDPLDIALLAYELGYEEANEFIQIAPIILAGLEKINQA